MTAMPQPLHTSRNAIFEAIEAELDRQTPRMHLGASEIGDECARRNWYTFRWVGSKPFDGRMLRLFERGNREEGVIIADLRRAGITVHDRDADGKQYEVSAFGGHFAGHLDAVGINFPEAPKTWHVAEFKTHSDKRFNDLVKNGLKEGYRRHYFQTMVYMGSIGLKDGIYFGVNKDNDDVYVERIKFVQEDYDWAMKKAESIIFAPEPPPRISERPDWWKCKNCSFHGTCHASVIPNVNCRTCAHSTPERDGTWTCDYWTESTQEKAVINEATLRKGCEQHRFIPILLDKIATVKQASDEGNWVQYELRAQHGGGTFVNGPVPGLTSIEIRSIRDPAILAHPAIEQMKAQFPQAKLLPGEAT